LKNLEALGLSTLGSALKHTFDLLNVNRTLSGIDTYGQVINCDKPNMTVHTEQTAAVCSQRLLYQLKNSRICQLNVWTGYVCSWCLYIIVWFPVILRMLSGWIILENYLQKHIGGVWLKCVQCYCCWNCETRGVSFTFISTRFS